MPVRTVRSRRRQRAFRPGHAEPLEARKLLTTLPTGFVETVLADQIAYPSAMQLAPDGRIFVAQSSGTVQVIKDGAMQAEPFLTLPVDFVGERGLVGMTLDPAFEQNAYVYVYYTVPKTETAPAFNRISRFEADGDVARPGSETVLLELDPLPDDQYIHNGGAMHFGPDGKLYVGVGDNADGNKAQRLDSFAGKMLRLNPDGSIPADNPLLGSTEGHYGAIWALGFRNPFTFAFQPGTGRMFINDVGLATYEEVNEGFPGANYGWPASEGPTDNPAFQTPVHYYDHPQPPGYGQACAITGGVFYNTESPHFPAEYVGQYLFADFCGAWIKALDPATGEVTTLASDTVGLPIDLDVDADGNLYYLTWRGEENGQVRRIRYAPEAPPEVASLPEVRVVGLGHPVTFEALASGAPPLEYQWQRNGVNIPGANDLTYTLPTATLGDDGAVFRVVVTNAHGSTTSSTTTLFVLESEPPTAAIIGPAEGTTYHPGDTINFGGVGVDAEDGFLPPSAYTWKVEFHHDAHTHPFYPPTSGLTAGSFTIPTGGHDPGVYWYRIHLTVSDSSGQYTTVTRDIHPASDHHEPEPPPPPPEPEPEPEPPPLPTPGAVVGRLDPASDNGVPGDNVTNARLLRFNGTGPARSFVTLYAVNTSNNSLHNVSRAWTGQFGSWRVQARALPPGSYHLWATWNALRQPVVEAARPIWPLDGPPLVVQSPPSRFPFA